MANWRILAGAHLFVGFEINIIGLMGSAGSDSVEGCLICGSLCYLIAVLLMVLMVFGTLSFHQIARIASLVLIFSAALLILVGVGLWGDNSGGNFPGQFPYSYTLEITSSAMAVLAGAFTILDVTSSRQTGQS